MPARDHRGRLLGRLPSVARTAQQVERHAAAWDASNARALAAEGPLWVVPGDSAVVNRHLRRLAAERGLLVADLEATTGCPHPGEYADGHHPDDRGYRRWAEAVTRALDLSPPAEEPLP